MPCTLFEGKYNIRPFCSLSENIFKNVERNKTLSKCPVEFTRPNSNYLRGYIVSNSIVYISELLMFIRKFNLIALIGFSRSIAMLSSCRSIIQPFTYSRNK